jgi:hypothetical protein
VLDPVLDERSEHVLEHEWEYGLEHGWEYGLVHGWEQMRGYLETRATVWDTVRGSLMSMDSLSFVKASFSSSLEPFHLRPYFDGLLLQSC